MQSNSFFPIFFPRHCPSDRSLQVIKGIRNWFAFKSVVSLAFTGSSHTLHPRNVFLDLTKIYVQSHIWTGRCKTLGKFSKEPFKKCISLGEEGGWQKKGQRMAQGVGVQPQKWFHLLKKCLCPFFLEFNFYCSASLVRLYWAALKSRFLSHNIKGIFFSMLNIYNY